MRKSPKPDVDSARLDCARWFSQQHAFEMALRIVESSADAEEARAKLKAEIANALSGLGVARAALKLAQAQEARS